jgi:membrane-bound lytic murein transglycosylase B
MSQVIPTRLFLVALFALLSAHAVAQEKMRDVRPRADLSAFVQQLWPDAQARGVSRRTFDTALSNLTIDSRVAAATLRQPEFGRPIGTYVNGIATA